MAFVVGEVREFATGMLTCESYPGGPGTSYARMQTEQRIWSGEQWLAVNEPGAADVLRSMIRLSTAA
jgi:hypothetical protein